jgi:hypothetical protein
MMLSHCRLHNRATVDSMLTLTLMLTPNVVIDAKGGISVVWVLVIKISWKIARRDDDDVDWNDAYVLLSDSNEGNTICTRFFFLHVKRDDIHLAALYHRWVKNCKKLSIRFRRWSWDLTPLSRISNTWIRSCNSRNDGSGVEIGIGAADAAAVASDWSLGVVVLFILLHRWHVMCVDSAPHCTVVDIDHT